ncbi:MAG: hypothetical protein LIR50_14055 [Bacillota bacterium]|nr:hypothetical protein [Bacillota bacterium]
MVNIKDKNPGIEFKHGNDKFDMEAAQELGIDTSNAANVTTAKIIYAYELGLKNKL